MCEVFDVKDVDFWNQVWKLFTHFWASFLLFFILFLKLLWNCFTWFFFFLEFFLVVFLVSFFYNFFWALLFPPPSIPQGHIAIDSSVFPSGTPGFVLDVKARTALWEVGLDYRHGTDFFFFFAKITYSEKRHVCSTGG